MRLVKKITLFILIMSILSAAASASEVLNISVDKNSVIKETMGYGIGGEWEAAIFNVYMNSIPGRITAEEVASVESQTGFTYDFIRQAGATSSKYNWKDALGYVYNRPISETASELSHQNTHMFGVPEILKLILQSSGNDKKFIYCIGMQNDREEDIADLAEFFYGDGTVNYNGGVNWAKLRIERYGIKEPVEIFAWELGNEYDQGGYHHAFINDEKYVEQCMRYIAAIRGVNPKAKISVCATMHHDELPTRSNRFTIRGLNDLAPYIDYVTIHGYHQVEKAYVTAEAVLSLAKEADRVSGGRIRIIDTEFGVQGNLTLEETSALSGDYTNYGPNYFFVGGATIADYLVRMANIESYASGTIYGLAAGTGFSFIHPDSKKGKYTLKPTGMVYTLFKNHCNGKVIKVATEGFESLSEPAKVSSAAYLQEDGSINLVLVNMTYDDDFTIKFDKKYKILEEYRIYGTNGWKSFGLNYAEVKQETTIFDKPETIDIYDLQKNNIVLIKLREVE